MAAMLKPGKGRRPFNVVVWEARAITALERRPLPLDAHPEGEGPAAKAEVLRGFGGTGLCTKTSALAFTAPLRMLARALWVHS